MSTQFLLAAAGTCVAVLAWLRLLRIMRQAREVMRQMTGAPCPRRVSPACVCTGCAASTSAFAYSASCYCKDCLLAQLTGVAGNPGGGGGGSSASPGATGGKGSSSGALARHVSGPQPPQRSRASNSGIAGFDGATDGYEFAIGSVHGLRQWKLPFDAAFHATMASAAVPSVSALWPEGTEPPLLTGVTGMAWPPGIVQATCNNYRDHEPPVEFDAKRGTTCGCGFWGYWSMADRTWHDKLPVFGIMEGTGRVVIGSKGFRAQKGRIIALMPAFAIEVSIAPARPQLPYGGYWQDAPASPVPVLSQQEAHDRERELAEARQRADAWLAVVMDLLGLMYPEARVFATMKAMLASVPPGEVTQ